jgi:hypothetical protein
LIFRNRAFLIFVLLLLGIATLASLTWVNYRYSRQNPGGSDFLARWVGVRAFLSTGQSPYSKEITWEIQKRFFGRLSEPDEDQVLFVYPFYSIFVFAPFAMISDFDLSRGIWMTVLEVSIVLITLGAVSLSRWKPSSFKLVFLLIFGLLWYYSVRPLINSNVSVLVGLFVVGAFLAIRDRRDFWAGFFLALAMIKPQVVILLVLYVVIWSLSERRYLLFSSLAGVLALMVIISSILLPNWIWQNLNQVLSYPGYSPPGTPVAIFGQWMPGLGRFLGWLLTILLSAVLIWEWRVSLGKKFDQFLWTSYLTLGITTMIGIQAATENYVVLLPAVVLIFVTWYHRWGKVGRVLVGTSYILLFAGVWWLFLATLTRGAQPMQGSIMFFPLPVFLAIGLYSMRGEHDNSRYNQESGNHVENGSINNS